MPDDPFPPPASQPGVSWPGGRPFDPPPLPETALPPVPPREPVVLPLAPRLGWARAGTVHRTLAVACAPVLLAQLAVSWWALVDRSPAQPAETPQGTNAVYWLLLVSYLLAPPTFYAAARVLRPHVRRGGERAVRHLMAATALALAVPVTMILAMTELGGAQVVEDLRRQLGAPPFPVLNQDNQFAVLILLGVPAFLLGAVTVLWGTAAVVARAVASDRQH